MVKNEITSVVYKQANLTVVADTEISYLYSFIFKCIYHMCRIPGPVVGKVNFDVRTD